MKKYLTSWFVLLLVWWLAILWTYSSLWPRPFDDWKNGLLYFGVGLAFILFSSCPKMLFSVIARSGSDEAIQRKQLYSLDRHVGPSTSSGPPRDDRQVKNRIFGQELFRKSYGERSIRLTVPHLLILAYFVIALISIFSYPAPAYEGLLAFARLLLWVALAFVMSRLSPDQWRILGICSVISGAVIAIITAFPAVSVDAWTYKKWFVYPVGHVSYFGDFTAASIPMTVILIVSSRRWWWKIVWFVFALLVGLGLWTSGTRSSLAGLAVGGVFSLSLYIWSRRRIPWRTVVVAVSLFILFFVGGRFLNLFTPRSETMSDRVHQVVEYLRGSDFMMKASLDARVGSAKAAIDMIRERPLIGWGLGSFRFIYPEYGSAGGMGWPSKSDRWFMHPHNEILHQAAEVGLVGLGLLISLLILSFIKAFKMLRPKSSLSEEEKQWLFMALSGLVIIGICWQFSTSMLFPVIRLMAALYAGILWHYVSPQLREIKSIRFRRPVYILVSLVVVGAVLLLTSYHISLYFVKRQVSEDTFRKRLKVSRIAYYLAPGAFDSMYVYTSNMIMTGRFKEARPIMDRFYENYPYVPAVLYQRAKLYLNTGEDEKACGLLEHAIRNAPSFEDAKELLTPLKTGLR